ncbi:hypothetical protein ACE4ZU_26425, partial [Salmonella enterica]|uniref:hypothetical protein n=1 Tax=Salmonella enterica TaxID=28901 RepID=UPI003D2A600B
SFSLTRRILDYWARSDYGKSVLELWARACSNRHYTCSEWKDLKARLRKESGGLASYRYEDAKHLEKFVSKDLEDIPRGTDLERFADRMVKG